VAFVTGFAVPKVSIATTDGVAHPDGMSEQDVARYRAQADECQHQAERAVNPLDKERWPRLAGDWIKMAQEAEKRLGKG
jgi:hypothetical protein